ncbi:MAG: phosphatase PAP2 family protein [Prevotella sp.]|nr:phosphatase PAP2 family protein [Prevotella sp.]
MIKLLKDIFTIDKHPRKGLMPLEWVVLGYLILTSLLILFTYTELEFPLEMLKGRGRVVVMTLALWIVYRLVPCRFTLMFRVLGQMALLSWWYPDTYDLNRIFPNLDHVFATTEQSIFGYQPALAFCKEFPSAFFSELMDMGYASYYPMIAVVCLFYFFCRYEEFEKCSFIILTSFFIYYIIYVFLPVTGPTFYFKAVGIDNIAQGIFPNVRDYFKTHLECFPSPGDSKGLFYQLVEGAKAAGERPTAAFPSSHVGISTICMVLAWRSGSRKLFYLLLPFFILLCFSTVYIQAHYAIDASAGLFTGLLLWYLLDKIKI